MSWVEQAEAALARGQGASEDERVLMGRRPPLLDGDGVKAVLSPFLAGIVWASAVFREMVAGSPLDPIALFLRLLALGLTLRVVLLGGLLLRRLGVWLSTPRYGLVLRPEGLLLRTPDTDFAVPREAVVGVVERGRWQERAAGRRWSEVFIALDPDATGHTHVTLPPVFDDTPGRLAERLMRWRGGLDAPEVPTWGPPADLPSKLWDEAAKGNVPAGVTAVRHGLGWLRKAPYAPVLVGVAAIEGLVRAGPSAWEAISPLVGGGIVLVLSAIPLRWLWMTRQDVAPRKGISLLLTPGECLIRTKQGILRTGWKDLARVWVDSKKKWSVLEGAHPQKQLVLTRTGAPTIRYDEPYLGIPVEVGQMLVEAYRTGALPRQEAADAEREENAEAVAELGATSDRRAASESE